MWALEQSGVLTKQATAGIRPGTPATCPPARTSLQKAQPSLCLDPVRNWCWHLFPNPSPARRPRQGCVAPLEARYI